MDSTPDLKLVAYVLANPPFQKSYTAIQLHDDVPSIQLLQNISEVLAFLDSANKQSLHRAGIDIRAETPADLFWRVDETLKILKFKPALEKSDAFKSQFEANSRVLFLQILHFLCKDLDTHKKRLYLAVFLSVIHVPDEFLHENVTSSLWNQVLELQEEFKQRHRYVETIRGSSASTAALKREIQQAEEEKQQVLFKIKKIKAKVQDIPMVEALLEAAKRLRLEQRNEITLAEKIKEQRAQSMLLEKKIAVAQANLTHAKEVAVGKDVEKFIQRLQDEVRVNTYLVQESLPKSLEEESKKLKDLTKIITESAMSEGDMKTLQAETKVTIDQIAALKKKQDEKEKGADNKQNLFVQQAVVISAKKSATAQQLSELMSRLGSLRDQVANNQSSSSSIPKGEAFKRYVTNLRIKSTEYKSRKSELADIATEIGVLERTEEILKAKETTMENVLKAYEAKQGIIGYHETQANLERVSEQKSELDEAKGKTLDEISALIKKITTAIGEKKDVLSPIIQQLRGMRAEELELENQFQEKRKAFNAAIMGIDKETEAMEASLKEIQGSLASDQISLPMLQDKLSILEVIQSKIAMETTAILGPSDDALTKAQAARGFKSYKELYIRLIDAAETESKVLRDAAKELKSNQEPNKKQVKLFNDIKTLLQVKLQSVKERTSAALKESKSSRGGEQDRLVL